MPIDKRDINDHTIGFDAPKMLATRQPDRMGVHLKALWKVDLNVISAIKNPYSKIWNPAKTSSVYIFFLDMFIFNNYFCPCFYYCLLTRICYICYYLLVNYCIQVYNVPLSIFAEPTLIYIYHWWGHSVSPMFSSLDLFSSA